MGSNLDSVYLNNFTLMICGPHHDYTKKMVDINERFFENIIISRWVDGRKLPSRNIKIIESQLPNKYFLSKVHNSQNVYLQTITVLAGLNQVKTPYVIKSRSDEYFSNLTRMVSSFRPDKLLSSNIFVRDVTYRPFHISDHLLIARVDRLKKAFYELKQYIELTKKGGVLQDEFGILNSNTPAEVKISLFYLKSCGYDIPWLLNISKQAAFDIMKSEFDLFDIDELSPLAIKSSVASEINCYRKYVRRDSLLGIRHFTKISQLGQQSKLLALFHRGIQKLKRFIF